MKVRTKSEPRRASGQSLPFKYRKSVACRHLSSLFILGSILHNSSFPKQGLVNSFRRLLEVYTTYQSIEINPLYNIGGSKGKVLATAVFHLSADSAPGEFTRHRTFLYILLVHYSIGDDLCLAVQDFFRGKPLPRAYSCPTTFFLRLLYFATPASTTCGLLHANPLFDSPCKGLNPPLDEEPE